MVRTDYVELSTINGVAYRQKLKWGGTGLVVHKKGTKQPGIAEISKRGGDPKPTDNTNTSIFTSEVFEEALELTKQLSYAKRKPYFEL